MVEKIDKIEKVEKRRFSKMKKLICFAVAIMAVCTAIGQTNSSPSAQTSAAEQEVRKLEREWLDAYEKRDAKAMDAIVAEDFVITFTDGSLQTKPQIMSSIRAGKIGNYPAYKFYTEEVQARVYGDTIILRGRVTTEYVRDGKTVKEQSRYTDTYIKRKDRWQVVASHLSNVPKTGN